jgi:hypothetical protein
VNVELPTHQTTNQVQARLGASTSPCARPVLHPQTCTSHGTLLVHTDRPLGGAEIGGHLVAAPLPCIGTSSQLEVPVRMLTCYICQVNAEVSVGQISGEVWRGGECAHERANSSVSCSMNGYVLAQRLQGIEHPLVRKPGKESFWSCD